MNSRYGVAGVLLVLFVLGGFHPAAALFHLFTGENHGELRWHTLESAHFRVHYPEGLEATAAECASVAEQAYGPVTRQLGLEPRHRTEFAITDTDQIVNGFAFPRHMAVWVHQNDYVLHFSQNRDWLRQVIAHEFQHVVTLEALRDWRGKLGLALSGTPGWWLEGLAEYYTENWNVLRSDRSVRAECLDRRLEGSDPHDGGFSRVLYLAWRDGDSTLVKLCRWRDPLTRTFSFRRAFREVTGQSLEDFTEEWTRVLNTVYHAELAAGEPLDEIGTRLDLPLAGIRWLALLPDSSAWLAIGREQVTERTNSLYRIPCDSHAVAERLLYGRLRGGAALAADGRSLVVDRWGANAQVATVSDLWHVPLGGGKARPLKLERRAQDPCLASDGALACVTTVGDRHRLELRAPEDSLWNVLWDPGPGWQLQTPAFSPDGLWLALAVDDSAQFKDIVRIERLTGRMERLGQDFRDERRPLWLDNRTVLATVFEDYRPNLVRLGLDGSEQVATASGEGLWGSSRIPGDTTGTVLALALDSARVSRPLRLDGWRTADARPAEIRPRYRAWRERLPEIRVPDGPAPTANILDRYAYRPLELQPLLAFVVPMHGGATGLAVFADPLAHNLVSVYGGVGNGHWMHGGAGLGWVNHSFDWTLGLGGSWRWDPALAIVNGRLVEIPSSSLELWAGRRRENFPGTGSRLFAGLGLRVEDTPDPGVDVEPGALAEPRGGRSGRLVVTAGTGWAPVDLLTSLWPYRAHGVRVRVDLFRPWFFGSEHLNLIALQAYHIQPTPLKTLKLVLNGGFHGFVGETRSWRSLGLGPDPLLEPVAEWSQLGSPIPEAPLGPLSRLRGLGRELAADRVLAGSAELRQTLGTPDVFRLGPLRNGRINLAVFWDGGQVTERSRVQPGAPDPESLWTTGAEVQLGLRTQGSTFLSLAGGYGGEGLDWLGNGGSGRWYWKFHLGRPF